MGVTVARCNDAHTAAGCCTGAREEMMDGVRKLVGRQEMGSTNYFMDAAALSSLAHDHTCES